MAWPIHVRALARRNVGIRHAFLLTTGHDQTVSTLSATVMWCDSSGKKAMPNVLIVPSACVKARSGPIAAINALIAALVVSTDPSSVSIAATIAGMITVLVTVLYEMASVPKNASSICSDSFRSSALTAATFIPVMTRIVSSWALTI